MNKIFMKIGWPTAVAVLVIFLSLAFYLIVDRAIVKNEQTEQEIPSENLDSSINDNEKKTKDQQQSNYSQSDTQVTSVNEDNSTNVLSDTQVTSENEDNSTNALVNDKSDSENSEKDSINIKKKEKDSIKTQETKTAQGSQQNLSNTQTLENKSDTVPKVNNANEKSNNQDKTKGLVNDQDGKKPQEGDKTEVDIIRVDETGVTVIAGKADPESTVEVRIESEVVGTTQANEEGDFVIIGQLSSSDTAQEVKILTKDNKTKEFDKNNKLKNENDWVVSSNSFFILPGLVLDKDSKATEVEQINSVAIVEVKEDNLLVKQDKSPIKVDKVTLDRIKYSNDGNAIIFGRARSKMSVFVYLDNSLRTKIKPAIDGSWSVNLGVVIPGIYKLRLDEVDSKGTVLSRIESPFKQEAKDLLDKMFADAITVQPGNSLWRISRRIYGRGILYIEIFKKNSHLIKNPDLIYPGQVFSLLD